MPRTFQPSWIIILKFSHNLPWMIQVTRRKKVRPCRILVCLNVQFSCLTLFVQYFIFIYYTYVDNLVLSTGGVDNMNWPPQRDSGAHVSSDSPSLKSLRRRANARNVSSRISLRWPIHFINPVDKTKLSCNTPTDAAPQFLINLPLNYTCSPFVNFSSSQIHDLNL